MLRTRIIAVVAIALAATTAAAQNLISNPTFDVSVASWSVGIHSSIDALGRPTSGSLLLTNSSSQFNTVSRSSCVAATGGAKFDGRVDALVPAGSGAYALLYFESFAGTDCSGVSTSYGKPGGLGDGQWHTITYTSYAMPANARSAVLSLRQRIPAHSGHERVLDVSLRQLLTLLGSAAHGIVCHCCLS